MTLIYAFAAGGVTFGPCVWLVMRVRCTRGDIAGYHTERVDCARGADHRRRLHARVARVTADYAKTIDRLNTRIVVLERERDRATIRGEVAS